MEKMRKERNKEDEARPLFGLQSMGGLLLSWYDRCRRILPWREDPQPYHVWLSEIMLQQTRVEAVKEYYSRFLRELPTIRDLAAAPEDKLLKLWEGLGYYNRVRNLQKAAQIVMEQHGGALPADYDALLKLPGVGAYTAGAIASISFGLPVPAVDGNVLRVFARILNDGRDVTRPDVKKDLTARVMELQPPERPGDYNQALMELGAIGVPAGRRAPVQRMSLARAVCGPRPGRAGDTARKGAARCKKNAALDRGAGAGYGKPARPAAAAPAEGASAGLWQPVLLEGARSAIQTEQALAALGVTARAVEPLTPARHVFSHLVWEMDGFACAAQSCAPPPGCVWAGRAEVDGVYTLPGAFKAYRPVLKNTCKPAGKRI